MNVPLWMSSSLVLDARRAVWLPRERTIAVADLHLGFPSDEPDETAARLLAVMADYQPEQLVFLGETIHPGADPAALASLLSALLKAVRERAGLILVHDRPRPEDVDLLVACGWKSGFLPQWHCGHHRLLHGSERNARNATRALNTALREGGRLLAGYEHPAIALEDGAASRVLCPCFALWRNLLVIPSFNAFTPMRELGEWGGALAKAGPVEQVVAIVAGKLLPVDPPTA